MSDPRITPVNARVAAAHLPGAAPNLRRVTPEPLRVTRPVVDLLRAPGGARDRQLLWGEAVDRYEDHQGISFVQARRDGYVGYLSSDALGPERAATHWVSAPATHAAADLRAKIKRNVGVTVKVELAEPGGVVRSQGKAVRIIDNRPKA